MSFPDVEKIGSGPSKLTHSAPYLPPPGCASTSPTCAAGCVPHAQCLVLLPLVLILNVHPSLVPVGISALVPVPYVPSVTAPLQLLSASAIYSLPRLSFHPGKLWAREGFYVGQNLPSHSCGPPVLALYSRATQNPLLSLPSDLTAGALSP